MTAIKATKAGSQGGTGDGSMAAHPLHSQHHGPVGATIASAKTNFAEAVANAIAELTRRCGYSRERATALLLRELRRGESSPGDDEVVNVMNKYGVGMEDASSALIVSRAIQRAKSERGLSAAEAIDDLTSRLSLSKLLDPDSSETYVEEGNQVSMPLEIRTPEKVAPPPTAPAARAAVPQRKASRKASKSKGTKHKSSSKNNVVTSKGGAAAKLSGRKRSAATEECSAESNIDASAFKGRARVDSVSEVVDAKIAAKKAKISPEDSPSADAALSRCKSPTQVVVRTKRGHRGDDTPAQAAPQTKKRVRSDV